MKGRVILLDMPRERPSRAALLVDGRVEDLLIGPLKPDAPPAPGQIYRAKVDRLVPKMGAAFIRLTPDHQGFLREAKGLKEGGDLLVQVSSYSESGKATPVTTRILYKGPRIIHTPDAPGVNISRRIKDADERERLKTAVLAGIERSDYAADGFIIRTAAAGAESAEIEREIGWVLAEADTASKRMESPAPPDYMAGDFSWAVVRSIRDWAFPAPASIMATSRCFEFLMTTDPIRGPVNLWGSNTLMRCVSLYDGPDLFDHYGVWDEIEKLKSPRVYLPSGAWIAVEATRAMVTIDVNTAGEFGGGASLTANLEAARELPRQLRLRGLGGQVAIDFAPLKKSDRKRIEDALKTSFRRDPLETTLAGWTSLGNFELQRKRERRPLSEVLP